ncbi:MAG: YdgA family protein [Deltaproteobacteria bacterium]|nr:YdgA family protein [Deltaproteobacteria bacterium]
MKTSYKILLFVAIIIVCIPLAIPFFYNQQFTKIADKSTNELKQNGIIIKNEKINDSYFKINREYTLLLKDASVLLQKSKLNLNPQEIAEQKKILDNTEVLVSIDLIKYPVEQDEVVKASLKNLSPYLGSSIKESKMGYQLLKFIEDKGLMLIASISSFDIKTIRLKDIDLNLYDEKNTFNGKIINLNAEKKTDKKIDVNLDELSIKINEKSANVKILFTEIKYLIEEINDLNLKNKFSVGFIEVLTSNNKASRDNQKFALNDLNYIINVDTIEKKINSDVAINIKTMQFIDNSTRKPQLFKMDSVVLNTAMKGLDEKALTELSEIRKTRNPNMMDLKKGLQTILNKGFSFNIDTLKFEAFEMKTKPFSCNLDTVTFKSNLNFKNNTLNLDSTPPMAILKYVNADAHLNTKKTNLDYFLTFFNLGNAFDKYINVKKGNASIDAELKDSVVTVNKQRVF